MPDRAYYPLFADVHGRRCLVVGGGVVAQRKVATLLSYGARVTVVSPTLTKRLASDVRHRRIAHRPRRFRACDVDGAWLVFAATDEQPVNERVYRAATRARVLTNVVDQKPLCSFIAPAIVRRGDLVIAISTGGASPALAKQLRRQLSATIGRDHARMLRLLGSLRGLAKRRLPGYQDRKRYFDGLVAGEAFRLVRAGRGRDARQEALARLRAAAHTNGA